MRRILKRSLVLFVVLFSITSLWATSNGHIISVEGKLICQTEAKNYRWFYNGKRLEGVSSNTVMPMLDGQYQVEFESNDSELVKGQVTYSTKASSKVQVIIIGDSTASEYSENKYPRMGWAQVLQPFLNNEAIEVLDMAISGRSSKSFYSDVNGWVKVLEVLGEGDYLFIQFGHNDQKADERYTDPYTTYQDYLSVYVDSARARGAHPVLLTSIHRNKWSGDFIQDSHGDYPPAMQELAVEKNVPLIDLHKKTKSKFEELGQNFTTNNIFMNLEEGAWVNYPTGNEDNTHLQELGAYEVCKLVVEDFVLQDSIPELEALKNQLVEVGRVSAMPSPNLAGKILGRGIYAIGDEVNLQVIENSGYKFIGWYEKDTLVSNQEQLTFTLNKGDRNFKAQLSAAYKVDVKLSPSYKGVVEGNGYYIPGDTVTISVSPIKGYQFVNWQINDQIISTDTALTLIMGEENVTYLATLEPVQSSGFQNIESSGVLISPNPAENEINIVSECLLTRIEFIDINGAVIYMEDIDDYSYHYNFMGKSSPEILLIKVETINGISHHKLILSQR